MTDSHHAPWRLDYGQAKGSLSPCIYNKSILNPVFNAFSNNRIRLVIASCDFDFLLKYSDRLIAYQNSPMQIPMCVGVYSPLSDAKELEKKLNEIKNKYSLSKLVFFIFYSEKLEWVLSRQQSKETRWDYRINYIRNARYNLIPEIWGLCGLGDAEFCLQDSSVYVVDFDNKFKKDLNKVIKSLYAQKKLVFSWNSLQSPNKNFPQSLSGVRVSETGVVTNHAYKIIKAGFTALAPNGLARQFLWLYSHYSLGDDKSLIFMRLFTFYFSDQVAMILALLDIRFCRSQNYTTDIAWIDIHTSNIVNLKDNIAEYLWYPKGKTLKLSPNEDSLK